MQRAARPQGVRSLLRAPGMPSARLLRDPHWYDAYEGPVDVVFYFYFYFYFFFDVVF